MTKCSCGPRRVLPHSVSPVASVIIPTIARVVIILCIATIALDVLVAVVVIAVFSMLVFVDLSVVDVIHRHVRLGVLNSSLERKVS